MLYVAYDLGRLKLELCHETGAKIALWNDMTERAVNMTIWTFRNPWIFFVLITAVNAAAIFHIIKDPPKKWLLAGLTTVYAFSLWLSWHGLYLFNKLTLWLD
jgi:hypothetical protein